MTVQEKQPHEMIWAELKNCSSQLAGLPAPCDGAPRTEWHKWAVAGLFLSSCRDAKSAEEGKILATNFVLQEWGSGLADLIPHIESALGRKLTEGELDEGRISRV